MALTTEDTQWIQKIFFDEQDFMAAMSRNALNNHKTESWADVADGENNRLIGVTLATSSMAAGMVLWGSTSNQELTAELYFGFQFL